MKPFFFSAKIGSECAKIRPERNFTAIEFVKRFTIMQNFKGNTVANLQIGQIRGGNNFDEVSHRFRFRPH